MANFKSVVLFLKIISVEMNVVIFNLSLKLNTDIHVFLNI